MYFSELRSANVSGEERLFFHFESYLVSATCLVAETEFQFIEIPFLFFMTISDFRYVSSENRRIQNQDAELNCVKM